VLVDEVEARIGRLDILDDAALPEIDARTYCEPKARLLDHVGSDVDVSLRAVVPQNTASFTQPESVSETLRLPLRAVVASSSAMRSSRSEQQSPPRSADSAGVAANSPTTPRTNPQLALPPNPPYTLPRYKRHIPTELTVSDRLQNALGDDFWYVGNNPL